MTLCIVWKPAAGSMQAVSDSRIAIPQAAPGVYGKIDFAPKLFALPYIVEGADSPDGTKGYLVNQTVGIATLGSFLSANILVGILGPIISRLQAQPGLVDVSLKSLAEVAADIFGRVVRSTASVLAEDALGTLLLMGKCPLTHQPEVWRIGIELSASSLAGSVVAVDIASGPQFFGSGAKRAKELYALGNHPAPSRVLQEVIVEQKEPTVGGVIQYGALEDANFNVFAVENYMVNHQSRTVHTGLFVAGLELLRADDVLLKHGFVPRHTFLRPFLPDVGYWKRLNYDISPFPEQSDQQGAV